MKNAVLLLFFLFLHYKGISQHFPYINYTTHNGLPQIQVREIFQDRFGFIWIGTKGGISRFNGEDFQNFLPNEYINYIGEEPSGNVIVLSRKGLYRFYKGDMKLIAEIKKPVSVVPGKNRIWIYDHLTISEYRKDTIFKIYQPTTIPNDSIFSVAFDCVSNKVFFSTRKSNRVFEIHEGKFNEVYWGGSNQVQIGCFENGKIYYALINQRRFSYINPKTGEEFFKYEMEDNLIKAISVSSLPVKQFIVSNDFRYILIDSLSGSFKKLDFSFVKAPWPVIVDNDNNFWVGSDNGLYQINNGPYKIFPRNFMNDFWTLIKGKDLQFYGAIYQKGLYLLNIEKQRKTEIFSIDKNGKKDSSYYFGASKDKNGILYFPTHYGTVKYDYLRAKKLETGVSLITRQDPISGQIVLGQRNGIAFLNEKEQIEYFIDSTGIRVNGHCSSIGFGPGGDIWVGTWLSLAVFFREMKTFVPVSEIYSNCPESGIVSMTSDYKNNLWMGGISGLWLFDVAKNEFTQIAKNFFNTYISTIISPDSSLLLIGTSYEIFALNLKNFYQNNQIEIKTYNFRNGFVAEETSQNGFVQDGRMVYIPSSTYTSVLDIDKISYIPESYNVLITKINGVGIAREEYDPPNMLYLERKINRLEFNFESVGFGLPTRIKFRHKLEGVDLEWSDWSDQKSVLYANLASGKYRFRVMAMNGSLLDAAKVKEDNLEVVISLPFYDEPYFFKYAFFLVFILAIVTFIAAGSWYFAKIKTNQREKQMKLFEIATLHAQLNPHFIFNFLSSVQGLISKNRSELANEYLLKFSKLMRAHMESSIKSLQLLSGKQSDENLLKDEIHLLELYVELEKMKYPDGKIVFSIELQDENLLHRPIPPMLIQPFVENAIKHGLVPKEGVGRIKISFSGDVDKLVCLVFDDGIGREKSKMRKMNIINPNKPRGMELVKKRVEILNQLGSKVDIEISDPENGGTIVKIIVFE